MSTIPYGQDVAHVHDVGFGDFAMRAAPGLLRLLRRRGIRKGLVVDLGCGSGLWAKELAVAGYDVFGVDISPAMVSLARRRVPRARFQVASVYEVTLPRCVAVTAIGECLTYRIRGLNHVAALRALFRRAHNALAPGGIFIFDVLEPGSLGKGSRRRRFLEGEDWAVLVEAEERPDHARLTRRITTFRRIREHFRRDRETHIIHLLQAHDVTQDLRETGFRVRTLRGYGMLRFRASHVGFVARKP